MISSGRVHVVFPCAYELLPVLLMYIYYFRITTVSGCVLTCMDIVRHIRTYIHSLITYIHTYTYIYKQNLHMHTCRQPDKQTDEQAGMQACRYPSAWMQYTNT